MKVAVIVPSISVDGLLERCVRECRRTAPDAEIIVLVDDAGGSDRLGGQAEVIETGPVTIGRKRNLGAERTDAPYLAFIDSDAYPDDGWLQHAVEILDADPTIAAVGGPNVSPPVQTRSERWVGLSHHSPLVTGWWRYRRDARARARDVGALPSCNLIVRRDAYTAVDGMNEVLFTAEDTDFCKRLVGPDRRIHFDPRVLVFHKDRDLSGFVVQRFTFGVAMVPLVRDGRAPDPSYTLASVVLSMFVLFVASGPAALRSTRWRRLWLATMGAYAGAVGVESLRLVDDPADMPGTALAILIGNLGPGVGAIAKAVGLAPDLRGVYRNDRSPGGGLTRR